MVVHKDPGRVMINLKLAGKEEFERIKAREARSSENPMKWGVDGLRPWRPDGNYFQLVSRME